MKTIKIILISIMTLISFTSCHAQRQLGELSQLKGAESVYVGKTMLRMAKNVAGSELKSSGIDPSLLMDKLTSVEIVTVQDSSSLATAKSLMDKFVADKNQEILADIKSDGEDVVITGTYDEATNMVSDLFIRISEPREAVAILMSGSIPLEVIQQAIDSGKKDKK